MIPSGVALPTSSELRAPVADLLRKGGALLLCALAVAACGSASSPAASPTGSTIYVANYTNVANPASTIAVVDGTTREVRTPITTASLPTAMALTPDGRDLLVANKGNDTLTEIDVRSGRVVRSITVGLEPDGVSIDPQGTLALVTNFGDNTVTPVTLPGLVAEQPVAVGSQPVAVTCTPDGREAAVTNFASGTVTVLDLPSLTTVATIAAGSEPVSAAFENSGPLLFVADLQTSSVLPIDVSTRRDEPPIALPGDPTAILWDPTIGQFAVSNGRNLSFVPAAHGAPVVSYPIAPVADQNSTASGVAIDPTTKTIWVSDGSGYLTELEPSNGHRLARVAVGGTPAALALATPA